MTSFVTHFEWDMAKYPAKQPLVSVVDTLAKVRGGPSPGGQINLCDQGDLTTCGTYTAFGPW